MTRKGKELIFISQIARDGCGVIQPVEMQKHMADDVFELRALSLSLETYTASNGMNQYVVKLSKEFNSPYERAWTEYTGSTEYVRSVFSMREKGMEDPYINNILRLAFDAGWNSK